MAPTAASSWFQWLRWGRPRCWSTIPAASDPGPAFSLAKLAETPTGPTPIGIFRDVTRPVYGRSPAAEPATEEQLADLLAGGDTWTVA